MPENNFLVEPPNPELRRLKPLLGKWSCSGITSETLLLGPSVQMESLEEFRWLDGGYFLVSSYYTKFGQEPVQTGVMYWGYDSEKKCFHNRFFSNNGPYTSEGNEYIGRVEGNTMIFTGPAKFQYELDAGGSIKVNPDGTITTLWWLQDDRGEWTFWMNNNFKKHE